ncbi:MFS transporter [Parvularcula oceani]|uniref:MFS transporter n=1 Tax=Parvularcula oceani TaxID=1247963 RepID=UPI0009DF0B78|nr:MFS transporter [Parvularcula oceani]
MSASTQDAAPAATRERMLGLFAAIAAISVAGAGFGHSIPLFAVLLERYGASDFVIGANTGVGAIAVVVATPLYPRLIARLGLKRFLLLSIAVMIGPYLAIYAAGDFIPAWYPLRFLFSMGASGMFVGSEVWINGAAPPERRGQMIGIYSTCLALGFALGPLMLSRTGYDGIAPFLAGIGIFSLAAIPILLARAPRAQPEGSEMRVLPVMKTAPVTFGASSVFGAVESATLVFLPVLAIEVGFGERVAAEVVTAYGIGLLALQYLIGQAADRIGILRMLLGCALGATLAAAALPLADDAVPSLFVCVFFLGGLVGGISTTGLILLGDRFQGPRLTAASTGYALAWGLGAIVGPMAAGAIRGTAGHEGMTILIVAILAAYACAVFARRGADLP